VKVGEQLMSDGTRISEVFRVVLIWTSICQTLASEGRGVHWGLGVLKVVKDRNSALRPDNVAVTQTWRLRKGSLKKINIGKKKEDHRPMGSLGGKLGEKRAFSVRIKSQPQ